MAIQIQRITDAVGMGLAGFTTRYGTMRQINVINTLALVLGPQCAHVIDLSTLYRTELPTIGDSNAPKWSRTDPSLIYFNSGDAVANNQLKTCNVLTGEIVVLHTFAEYRNVTDHGEADISPDGDHFV